MLCFSLCFKVDCEGRGCAAAYTRHLLDLWCSCRQHTLSAFSLYFCCIQLITSMFFSTESFFFSKMFAAIYEKSFFSLFSRGSLSSCFTVFSTLRSVLDMLNMCLIVLICHILWEKTAHTPNGRSL